MRVLRQAHLWAGIIVFAGAAGLAAKPTTSPIAVANPVLDEDFPDPMVLKAPDGFYYAYGTQGGSKGAMHNLQVARSHDLTHWQLLADGLPVKPGWASQTQDFWAPHVMQEGGRYYLYYSAKPDAALNDARKGLCLAVAISKHPYGPFTDTGRPLQCDTGFVDIDPMAFDDPATGKRLLFWGSGFGPIRVRELAADRISFAAGSAPTEVLFPVTPGNQGDYQRLIEGAWVLRREAWYYLFYSGDNCCGPKAHYAVMVARSRSAFGPYQTLGQSGRQSSSVILARNERWLAPGHNAIIRDRAGQDWIIYHAIDTRRPRSDPAAEVNTRRVMLLDRIVWKQGWPTVER